MESYKNVGLDYIDLYLMHFPIAQEVYFSELMLQGLTSFVLVATLLLVIILYISNLKFDANSVQPIR